MNERLFQEQYVLNFFCDRADGLNYKKVKATTVSADTLIIEEDLEVFLSQTPQNKVAWQKLLKVYHKDSKKLLSEIIDFLRQRMRNATNIAIFINSNKTITFGGVSLHLFYPSGQLIGGNSLFEQNIFSVVEELAYTFKWNKEKIFSFRPDLAFFVNGFYIGYSELKSNYNNQSARKDGIRKVSRDYKKAVIASLAASAKLKIQEDVIKKDFLKIFHKAIHITTTDLNDTYIIRNIAATFDAIKNESSVKGETYEDIIKQGLKKYPIHQETLRKQNRTLCFEEVCRALYSKTMLEKEILYYNFIERELKRDDKGTKTYHDKTGRLIAPRPKQKFGTDKIIDKIDEFLEHEQEDDYFINKLREELAAKNISESKQKELIEKRQKYRNNKHIYSLLLQYAAGFGKSNIIGWTALQLKDIKRKGEYVYDKIMLIVDRLQLRDQLDTKMRNMNINNRMFVEATDKKSFIKALEGNTRIVVVNLQKFNTIKNFLTDSSLEKLASLRIAFIIDEVHRSQSGSQNKEMLSLFDDLQSSFDNSNSYTKKRTKKNLIIGFTATPSDHTLTRFGEFDKYAENEKLWIPFDSYTMKEAIKDGYILNPIEGLVPVSAKMYFEKPLVSETDMLAEDKVHYISNKKIYENKGRIEAIADFVVARLLSVVYPNIKGRAKAMLAVSSISAAIQYYRAIKKLYPIAAAEKGRFQEAPIYIVYSPNEKYSTAFELNGQQTEVKVLQKFALSKNGLIIVVNKLQTGFDEPRLHTLFLDKEIKGINAIQTISRVNRIAKNKNDCKIIDFSHENVNIGNIKEAFENFSNVVISDIDPLHYEKDLKQYYEELKNHNLFIHNFTAFFNALKTENLSAMQIIENNFTKYIQQNSEDAKAVKKKANSYFNILHQLTFVIEIEAKYQDENFFEFWRRFINIFNTNFSISNDKEAIEVYYDFKIGIIAPNSLEEKSKRPKKNGDGNGNGEGNKTDIFKIIEERNKKEENIALLIEDFRKTIKKFYSFIEESDNGKRLMAKMRDNNNTFEEEEIYEDFERLYNKFIRRNRKTISDFFKRESKVILQQLYDDFENNVARKKS